MSISRVRLSAVIIAVSAVAIILAFAWPHLREDRLLSRYGQTAREAYVAIYRPQAVCYRIEGHGKDELVRLIREDTTADPMPKYATATLAEVVFIAADGSASVSCALHSLPGPKTAKSIEERMDYFEQMVGGFETATRVSSEVMSDEFDKAVLHSIRRQFK